MARKTGLGKGLSALFSEYEEVYGNTREEAERPLDNKLARPDFDEPLTTVEIEQMFEQGVETLTKQVVQNVTQAIEDGTAIEIPIGDIERNVNQPRKSFDADAMKELEHSIMMHGVIQPIIVVKKGGAYMIIAGERRWRAARAAGLKTIPAIVRKYTEQQIKEVSLIENLQREDLNPIDAAQAIKELMNSYSFTQEQVAERIGKSRSSVANTLRLLALQPQVIELVANGRLSSGHAKCLVVIDDPQAQFKLALSGCDNKVSVREFEKLVSNYLNPKPAPSKSPQSLELKELISDMQRVFATKVSALGNDKRGRIYIDYYSRDDLDRIFELIEKVKPPANDPN